ncbi:zf-HC2 domain-containing protein [Rodentibacter trehalosifermentans]|uniref:DsDNA-mimic protein n=1 Tax=Rodentibacter trehalosifermentans TaxID=1908263 RepID=A0A1V3IYS8_9PAST|nr:zf-HC2 domain-containing protein [Rodentibacter trehalosifermentans]OOF43140.1 dsDNA-mimic protein [Rodentibacter trehalosifermentans]OOF47552.1 dsDNA-mimic protein [Rodentibacter trehalosifermentans]OOF51869.1 dsDNA-mimic protein [Rodentibacter trehalosifermentans]
MHCRQATKIISDAHERSLNLQEKVGLRFHLMTCSHCRNFRQNCAEMSRLMKAFAQNTKAKKGEN